jgi:hypothetical protein
MQRNLRILMILRIFTILFFVNSYLLAHEDKIILDSTYPLKQRIDNLCAGHGLLHLKSEEITKISSSFSDNLNDIEDLLQFAATDNYLAQLTGLIARSDLSMVQKNDLLQKIYTMALDKEWSITIATLIEQTQFLGKEEIYKHTFSDDPFLKAMSLKSMNDHTLKEFSHKQHEKTQDTVLSQNATITGNIIQESNWSSRGVKIILWLLFSFSVMLILKFLHRAKNSGKEV